MDKVFLVAAGGAAGAVARYALGVQAMRLWGSAWPYGTLLANILGGLLMGALVGFLAHRGGADQERLRLLLGVGVLGGFTTFSAFSLETALMIERRTYGQAFGYATASVVLSVTALFMGIILARKAFA
ncbi:MAG: fluoride efflux transporter CrcB [Pseudomonadota bacterium]|mgnify:CR=1 FL=1|uniref:fluoride efflux transporter CrcB n=1 Tax=Phenylobacterium sp. TaxID=1871053 RepID=UPI0025CE6F0C|nr:fluoride efflux transporter CrcB [Phenylobacterium sp.]MBT9470906.1 fluoride efflux transporter CrcB [Phenylobacterium sp.]